MNPEEQAEFAEIICESFTENEIEQLEIYAHHTFSWVEAGKPFRLSADLILDALAKFDDEGSEDE